MPNAFVRKLRRFAPLADEEVAVLVRIAARPTRQLRGTDLVCEGERPQAVQLLLQGWACRYKALETGRRQIVGFVIPGDACDAHVTLLKTMDHSICLLTDAEVVAIPSAELDRIADRHKPIERALACSTLVDEATMREWLANVGQRSAYARVGHLICELWYRLKSIGQVDERDRFDFPLTQVEIGDALGLTSVHVNRMMRQLKTDGLIATERRRLTLLDPDRLAEASGFDPAYLSPGREPDSPRRRSESR